MRLLWLLRLLALGFLTWCRGRRLSRTLAALFAALVALALVAVVAMLAMALVLASTLGWAA